MEIPGVEPEAVIYIDAVAVEEEATREHDAPAVGGVDGIAGVAIDVVTAMSALELVVEQAALAKDARGEIGAGERERTLEQRLGAGGAERRLNEPALAPHPLDRGGVQFGEAAGDGELSSREIAGADGHRERLAHFRAIDQRRRDFQRQLTRIERRGDEPRVDAAVQLGEGEDAGSLATWQLARDAPRYLQDRDAVRSRLDDQRHQRTLFGRRRQPADGRRESFGR